MSSVFEGIQTGDDSFHRWLDASWQHPDASWRRMLLTQPPVETKLEFWSDLSGSGSGLWNFDDDQRCVASATMSEPARFAEMEALLERERERERERETGGHVFVFIHALRAWDE